MQLHTNSERRDEDSVRILEKMILVLFFNASFQTQANLIWYSTEDWAFEAHVYLWRIRFDVWQN